MNERFTEGEREVVLKHPFDNEDFAVACAQADKSGRWMGAMFWVSNGKVYCQVTTSNFPTADVEKCMGLFEENSQGAKSYQVTGQGSRPKWKPEYSDDEQIESEVEDMEVDDEIDEEDQDEYGFPTQSMRNLRTK
tara:strand:+ start:2376 stop:2780 length:405 start_codon:yes stop_codon:yes gene_type:complete